MAKKQLALTLYKSGNDKIKLFWKDTIVSTQSAMWDYARKLRDFLKEIKATESELPIIQVLSSEDTKCFIEFKVTSSKNVLMKKTDEVKIKVDKEESKQVIQKALVNEDYKGYKFLSSSLSKIWKEASKMAED